MRRKTLPKNLDEMDLNCQLQEFDEYAHRQSIRHFHLDNSIILSHNDEWVKKLEKVLKQKDGSV